MSRPYSQAPSPRMPAALQAALWIRSSPWMMRQCANRFGDTFALWTAPQGRSLVVSHPADIEEVFRSDPEVLRPGEGNALLEPLLGSNSLVLLDGARHLEQRKLLLPGFSGRMTRYADLMREVAVREIESWPQGQVLRARPRMKALTLEIILRAVMGVRDPERRDALRDALTELLNMLTDPKWTALLVAMGTHRLKEFPPSRRRLERVDDLLFAEIRERRQQQDGQRDDILSFLMDARHADGEPMSDQELRDEVLTMLVAGHESTASALSWAIERLARHPEMLRELARESREGSSQLMTAVVRETLRLRPPIASQPRTVHAPVTVAGYDLEPGTTVVISICLANRRPDIYRAPDEFRPERFLHEAPGTYTWIPFGGGMRRCLGASFAQLEMETTLREIACRTSIRPVRPEDEPTLRRGVTDTPRYNAEIIVGGAVT